MARHAVRQGECLSYIAHANGFAPSTLWEHPENRELRKLRGDPNVLLPGDVVVIPEKTRKEYAVETGQRHVFRRKGIPEVLDFQLRDADDAPRRFEPYVLSIDGETPRHGRTDEDGRLYERMPWNAQRATLSLNDGREQYELKLRRLDPLATEATVHPSGVRARLNSLGYACLDQKTEGGGNGERGGSGELDAGTRLALTCFQIDAGLPASGELTAETLAALEAEHRC